MSAAGQDPGEQAGGQPSEEELRAAYEAELSRIDAADMIAQAAVSLLNIGAQRLGAPAAEPGGAPVGQDLEQARDAIDAAGALLKILERRIPGELGPLRDALSRLQMAYAREAQGPGGEQAGATGSPTEGPGSTSGGEPAGGGEQAPGAADPASGTQQPDTPGPGPAESSGRLWVPGR